MASAINEPNAHSVEYLIKTFVLFNYLDATLNPFWPVATVLDGTDLGHEVGDPGHDEGWSLQPPPLLAL